MKKITALFFLLAGLNTTAQNWKLLDENKTYFYKHSDSLLITNTIKIDSTVNSVLDSVFHIHTTIKVCDTCTVIPSDAVGGVLFHAYAPEIFGNTPAYNVSSNDYQFSDGIIKQDAELSDTWIFNPLLSINATVVDKYEITLFGSLDSIKVIELSTLDTILISKNHGVLRYPDFENAGKYFLLCGFHEGQNSFGEYLPNMWRIYDFNVGDVFYYSHHLSYLSSIPDQCYEGINAKLSIVNVNPSAYSPSYNFFNTQEYYFGCLISGEHQEGTSNGPANYTIDSIRAYYENTYSGITSVAVVPDSWMLNPFYPFQYNSFEVDSPYILGTAVRRNFILHRFDNGYVKYIQTMSNFF
ncbi:MAG: hypothetical protein IPO32_08170 [Crocinitomicaceae bacterium]|nr:hypothetical protein [Crocinitomicaceae bacterium]